MSELVLLGAGFLAGVLAAARLRRGPKRETRYVRGSFDLVRAELDRDQGADRVGSAPDCNPAPHLLSLFAEALREPLRQLRREPARAAEAVERLERIVWQARMLVSRPRPMQATATSPIALLQEAAEEVPLLRDGIVTASWSLLNRQPPPPRKPGRPARGRRQPHPHPTEKRRPLRRRTSRLAKTKRRAPAKLAGSRRSGSSPRRTVVAVSEASNRP